MDSISRRQMMAVTAAGGLLTTTTVVNAQSGPFQSRPGDGGVARAATELPPGDKVAYHDPKEVADMPDFRFSLARNRSRRGLCHRRALPDDGSRPVRASEINNYGPGDLWFFPKGHGHSIQTIGDKPCHFILAFDNGAFSEHGTFSITDWIDVTPKDMLALSFGVPKDVFNAFPKGETYIQAGPVLPASEALDAPWPKVSTHKFSLLHDNRAARDFDGGTFRLATVDEWPISKSMSGGVMTIKPGAMRNLHLERELSARAGAARWPSSSRATSPIFRRVSGTRSRTSAMKIWKSCRLGTTASSKRLTSPSGCNPARVTCWPTTLPGYPKTITRLKQT